MTRIAACLVIICSPCPVLRATSTPAPAVVTVRGVLRAPRLEARPVQAQPSVPVQVVTSVRSGNRPFTPKPARVRAKPFRATKSTLSHRKPVRRARTAQRPDVFTDAPHTHAGLVAWSQRLPYPWPAIVHCESLRDDSWTEASSSWARGPFQFLRSTWRSLGLSGDPASYSWRYQYAAALRLRARDGIGAWDCARLLGIS